VCITALDHVNINAWTQGDHAFLCRDARPAACANVGVPEERQNGDCAGAFSEYGRRQLLVGDPNGIMIHLNCLIGNEGGRT
jgi:hypothetical protein